MFARFLGVGHIVHSRDLRKFPPIPVGSLAWLLGGVLPVPPRGANDELKTAKVPSFISVVYTIRPLRLLPRRQAGAAPPLQPRASGLADALGLLAAVIRVKPTGSHMRMRKQTRNLGPGLVIWEEKSSLSASHGSGCKMTTVDVQEALERGASDLLRRESALFTVLTDAALAGHLASVAPSKVGQLQLTLLTRETRRRRDVT